MTIDVLRSTLAALGVAFVLSGDGQRIGFSPASKVGPELRAAIAEHKAPLLAGLRGEPSPIVAGDEHWNPYIAAADAEAGRWGEEFVPGRHVAVWQPTRLSGLCGPFRSIRTAACDGDRPR